jgi:tetratricopeptide (TPR) repeat protein
MNRFDEADQANARARVLFERAHHEDGLADCGFTQGVIEANRGEFNLARELYTEALTKYEERGNPGGVTVAIINLAELEFQEGNVEEALRLVLRAAERESHGKQVGRLCIVHSMAAAYQLALGNLEAGRQEAWQSLRFARDAQNDYLVAVALHHLALLAALHEHVERAGRILGYTDRILREHEQKRFPAEIYSYEKSVAMLHHRLGDADIAKLSAEGATWSEDRAVEEALRD